MHYDAHGRELPDDTPLALPVGFTPPETLAEQIQRLVRTNVSVAASAAGEETFEEADDFDIPDDDDAEPNSVYEQEFDPVLGRAVTPDQILNDPRIKEQYAQHQEQLDIENAANQASGASGVIEPPATPETPLPKKDTTPTDL